MAATVAAIAWWQWSPALDAIVRAGRDPSTSEAYYRPLLALLDSAHTQPARIEVVPTKRHWEAAYVALAVPIARGWERQLDERFNPQFNEPGLTSDAYRHWLLDWGVQYVALSDARVDSSGGQEATLLAGGLSFLRPVYTDAYWKVWEVIDATGLVDGPAGIVGLGIDTATLHVQSRGDVLVRIHGSTFWNADPVTCIEPTPDGWILLRDARPGTLQLFLDETAFAPTPIIARQLRPGSRGRTWGVGLAGRCQPTRTVPASPSTCSMVPSATVVMAGTLSTAGMPSSRATIAA